MLLLMTSHISTLPSRSLPLPRLYTKVLPTGLLAGWADFLFFGHDVGVSFAIFIISLALAAVVTEWRRIKRNRLAPATFVLVFSVLPAVEQLNPLSSLIGFVGLMCFVLMLHRRIRHDLLSNVRQLAAFCIRVPFQLAFDALKASRLLRWARVNQVGQPGLAAWLVPISFTVMFLLLFAAANPLIENGLAYIDLERILSPENLERGLFWLAMVMLCWPFVRTRFQQYRAASHAANGSTKVEGPIADTSARLQCSGHSPCSTSSLQCRFRLMRPI